MPQIKIALIANGHDIHTEKLIAGLSLTNSFELYLISIGPESIRDAILKNSKIRRVFEIKIKKRYQYITNFFKVRKIIKNINPEVVYTVYLGSWGFLGSLVKNKSLLCHSILGSDIMVNPNRNILYRWIIKFLLWRGDFFVAPSETIKQRIQTLGAISDDKILVQQYGVNEEILDYPKQKKEYDIVSNRAWLPNSNIPIIIDIISQLKTEGPVKAVLVGEGCGHLAREIQQKISLSKSNIVCLGTLPHTENIAITAKSRFYISLTRSDGASLSLLEAMAIGTIPIVSDIAPNREWIKDGENGFLININNVPEAILKINYILSLPKDILEIMHKKNFEIIKERANFKINAERFNGRLISLFEKIVINFLTIPT